MQTENCGLPRFEGWVFNLSDEGIAQIELLRVVAVATNFGTNIAINWLFVDDSDWRGGLGGRPTECRYCR